MLWRKRYTNRLLKLVTGFILAIFILQSLEFLPIPSLFPVWGSVAEAANAFIDPNADGLSSLGTQTTCGGGGNFDCVNDAVRQPTAPSTGGDYITQGRNIIDSYTMSSFGGVLTGTSITVWMYHVEGATNFNYNVSLYDSSETVQYDTTQVMANRSTTGWGSVTFSPLTLTQAQLDGLVVQTNCIRSGGGNSTCTNYAMYADVTYTQAIDVTVATSTTQQNLKVGTTTAHVGGSFSITESTSNRDVTAITITENGTVDAAADLANIKLFYEMDTILPFDCDSVSYDGVEAQFGSTDTNGFSAADGTSVFSGTTVNITTTAAMCVYVVLDVLDTATFDETILIEIADPTTDITFTGSPAVSPATAVALGGTTNLEEVILDQTGYHWRNDDGSEAGATSATGGENVVYATFPKAATKRLRVAISNEGNITSDVAQYRLEFASKAASCELSTGWADVGAVGGDFDMSDSGNLTNGNDTTVTYTGITDPNPTFLTPNGAIRDTTSQTGNITLTSTEFVEIEYSIIASSGVSDGTTYCFRVTDASAPLDNYTNYGEATISADVSVSSIGTQVALVTIPTVRQNAGGAFVITGVAASTFAVTSITVAATGTDVVSDTSDIKLRYDLDITDPYDCAIDSYDVTDTRYGATSTTFTGNYDAVFTGSVNVSQTQAMCVYVEYDVNASASDGNTILLSILDPSNDVVAGAASVAPNSEISISGTTQFAAANLEQANYHWRNNDGNEAGASSATGDFENILLEDLDKNSTKRIRFTVGNTGLAASPAVAYRLEWAQKISSCGAASGWTRVDTAADAWAMSPTANLTDGGNTTDVSVVNGGVSDPATTFLASNGGVKDTNDTTVAVALPADNYLDLEYSVIATTNATQGVEYCFRVTDAGTEIIDDYTNYAEVGIKLDTDYKIQRGVSTITGTSITISAGGAYDAPASAANAFIRITNTQHTGAGPDTGNGNSNADDVTAYISNPGNITANITFTRSAAAIGNTRVAWEIIEYTGAPGGENEMIVRRHEVTSYITGATTANGTTEATIGTDADVAVFITSQYNDDAGRNGFDQGLSTAAWNTGTTQVNLTRGSSGNVSDVSTALVEFTGSNWKIQRVENTFSNAGSVETAAITAVNSLSRTFLHTQKRTTSNNHADLGHEVWMSGIGQISFLLDAGASTPSGHVSVAWVIENTQALGTVMDVTRGNGSFTSAGTGPEANNVSIGKTLGDLTISSLFVNNRSDEVQRSWPEPILSARIISATQYELWRSDTTSNINYRTEVVEWPTAARKLVQNYYRIYVDNDNILPTDPWPAGATDIGENAEMTASDEPLASGDTARIRMTLTISGAAMPENLDSFKLQYAEHPGSCSAVPAWLDVGEIGSTTAPWRGVNNTPVDGTQLSIDPPDSGDLLISVATVSGVAGTYEEQNPTATNPHTGFPGEELEYDWTLQHNGAQDKTSYCFRMTEADGTLLEDYNFWPVLRTVGYEPILQTWRWYGDETNITPGSPLAIENFAPIDVLNQDIIKLRLTLLESSGASGVNNKFEVQYSEYSDFSQAVFTLTSTTTCVEDSIWCYADGNGVDNVVIDGSVISDADACASGIGNGCGTHNEGVSTIDATFDQVAYSSTEYEFTIKHAGARASVVYYFRLYDSTTAEFVAVNTTYPSLQTQGPQLVFSVAGVNSGTTVAGIVTDVTTTATSIDFGILPFNTDVAVAQRITVDTNATEGYQVYKFADQQLLNSYSTQIEPITGTNAFPAAWNSGGSCSALSCFGYHTTDATLDNASGRFGPQDSYAAISTGLSEVMYSSVAANEFHDILYRIRVSETQPAGDYETGLTYMAVPVF